MVTLKQRVFSVIGVDSFGRQQAVRNIRTRILKDKPRSLNTHTIYGGEVELKALQETLATVSFDSEKMVVFKDALKISAKVREYLYKNLKIILTNNYLIFEMEKNYPQLIKEKRVVGDKLWATILKDGVVLKLASPKKEITIEDFKYALRRNDLSASIYALEKLLGEKSSGKERELAPFILGVLTAEISYRKDLNQKERAFHHLWQADRQMKEKGLDARMVLEKLVTRLIAG